MLLAFHFWMLDYAADGGRQGFPFDPYLLYFHRRLIRGHDALVRLLSRPVVAVHAAKTLCNLRHQLGRYRDDPQIIAAASHYEIALREFDRLRTTLRLCADGISPMHHGYDLNTQGRRKLTRSFDALPAELMLIPNLRNSEYINVVLGGSLDHLATKFAEANSSGSSYASWRQTNTSLNLGRIPSRLLREENLVNRLIEIYDGQCYAKIDGLRKIETPPSPVSK